jgi:hypothetical protein
MKLATNDRRVGYFVFPALALVTLLFVMPLGWFFFEVFHGPSFMMAATP